MSLVTSATVIFSDLPAVNPFEIIRNSTDNDLEFRLENQLVFFIDSTNSLLIHYHGNLLFTDQSGRKDITAETLTKALVTATENKSFGLNCHDLLKFDRKEQPSDVSGDLLDNMQAAIDATFYYNNMRGYCNP